MLQEIWLPFSEKKFIDELLPEYHFRISTPDMHHHEEDLMMKQIHSNPNLSDQQI